MIPLYIITFMEFHGYIYKEGKFIKKDEMKFFDDIFESFGFGKRFSEKQNEN